MDFNDFGLIFFRMLNGLPDETNLFWRCSSPLSVIFIYEVEIKLTIFLD